MNDDGIHHATIQSPALIFGIPVTFIVGVLAGQFSVLVIAIVLIRLIIFEDPRSKTRTRQRAGPMGTRSSRGRKNASSIITGHERAGYLNGSHSQNSDVTRLMYELLSKVHYEIDSHPAETIDWLNVIVAQALAGYRQDMHSGGWSHGDFPLPAAEQGSAREWVETVLNTQTIAKGISFLDPIEVTHIDLGDSYPILSNAKVRPADDLGRMRVEVDVDFHDCIAIAIETKLVFNMPRPRFAVLPLSLGLTIERFSGTLAIELFSNTGSSMLPTPSTSSVPPALRSRHELHFSLHPDFSFDASASSLVGSRAKLQDLPKIEQLLVDRIRNYIHERFVWPRYWGVSLPNLISKRGSGSEGIANGGPDAPKASQMTEEEKASNLPNVDATMRDAQHNGSESSEIIQADHSIPGTLPLSVEAWREHSASIAAANMSIHRDIRRRR